MAERWFGVIIVNETDHDEFDPNNGRDMNLNWSAVLGPEGRPAPPGHGGGGMWLHVGELSGPPNSSLQADTVDGVDEPTWLQVDFIRKNGVVLGTWQFGPDDDGVTFRLRKRTIGQLGVHDLHLHSDRHPNDPINFGRFFSNDAWN